MGGQPLSEADVEADPIRQFNRWFDQAKAAGQPEPEAMAVATATAAGEPSVRFVLLRGLDTRGFVFYTNSHSRKGREVADNPVAALVFRWWTLERQVRVSGPVRPVEPAESDAYFKTRPRGAQLGAWASAQSELLSDRAVLEEQLSTVTRRFAGREVPRPPWWGGYRVRPAEVEFWQGRPDRLHDRLAYRLAGGRWRIHRLSP
ncbi:MAG TPA: pyridoxamine 5'-phosphate oxidase [Acidimicrobiales bacterium]|jgi:pyridoxamine 5'-phosphate oxidase